MTKPPTIYFYCCGDEGNLQEDIVALGEGLRNLGVPFYSSSNYWREHPGDADYLFRHSPDVVAADCDVVVVSYTWPYFPRLDRHGGYSVERQPLPKNLFAPGRRYKTVYMDHHDGYRTVSWEPEFRAFDLILRAKLNRRTKYFQNVRPWALGTTNRIIAATADAPAYSMRRKEILVNFGASHPYPHGARELAARKFEPAIATVFDINRSKDDLSKEPGDAYDALMWKQTARRYSRAYYDRLKHAQAVACFCGDLIPPMPFNPEKYLRGGKKARLLLRLFEAVGLLDPRPPRAIQWDSFRFWESLCAGCVAFNIDLDRYGVELPAMPQNWTHYVGVDFDRVGACIDRLRSEPHILQKIAQDGHAWAMEHYSPTATARRFLRLAGFER